MYRIIINIHTIGPDMWKFSFDTSEFATYPEAHQYITTHCTSPNPKYAIIYQER